MIGAAGRMGATVCAAVAAAGDLELVAAVDPVSDAGRAGRPGDVSIAAELDALAAGGAEVAVDFTVAAAATANALWCAAHGIHSVIGTTGLDEAALAELADAFPSQGATGCVVAPNFAIGAVLMMRFAELAAPWFETAEIIELHHDAKVERPPGRRCPLPPAWRPRPPSGAPTRRGSRRSAAPAVASGPAASASTPYACGAWWLIRRSCWGPPARA